MDSAGSMEPELTAEREKLIQAIARHHRRGCGCAVGAAAIAATTTVLLVAVAFPRRGHVLCGTIVHPGVHGMLTVASDCGERGFTALAMFRIHGRSKRSRGDGQREPKNQ